MPTNYLYGTPDGVNTNLKQFGVSGNMQITAGALDTGANLPTWQKFTIGFASLQTAGLTNTVLVYTLPIKGVVHQAFANITTLFSGGAIATIVASIGNAGNNAKYMVSSSLATATTLPGVSIGAIAPESMVGTTAVNIYATSTVANLSALTQGSIDVYVLSSVLP